MAVVDVVIAVADDDGGGGMMAMAREVKVAVVGAVARSFLLSLLLHVMLMLDQPL